MSKPDQYHDCGHRLRRHDKRKRVQETPEESSVVPTTSTDKTELYGPEVLNPTRILPVVKESLTAQSKTPRTEASQDEAANFCGNVIVVPVEIAEQLETELAEAKALFRDGPNGIKFRLGDWTFHDAYGWIPAPAAVGIDSDYEELTEERDQLRAKYENAVDKAMHHQSLWVPVQLENERLRAKVERLEREFGEISIQCERVTVCLSSMVAIAKNDDWHLATTGRQIVVRESEEALESTKPSVGGDGNG